MNDWILCIRTIQLIERVKKKLKTKKKDFYLNIYN
jgi:hypothetical protein